MHKSEADLLEQLNGIFPTTVIFAEQYLQISPMIASEVRKLAKSEGLTSAQWLTEKGFIWKATGYIEPDMSGQEGTAPQEIDAFSIADYVLRSYPLAGEYHPTDLEVELLYRSACETVKKALRSREEATLQEEAVLVVETINLLKRWSTELEGEESTGTFWNYIFLQYGFNPDNSDAARANLYGFFRGAIKKTMNRYERFFAPKETQRYYTTLLLHAISPTKSIEAFFNILFDFYVNNLDFQYVAEDTSYKLFTKGMRARWDSSITLSDDLRLRSDAISSGLKTLFMERPGYMAVLSDTIVKKMDAILRGEDGEVLDGERNYWDILLLDWYRKKSSTERMKVQGERRKRKAEFIATTPERIYVQYAMEQSRIGISIPKIRLPEFAERRPEIRVYQGSRNICSKELSVTGNDLCLTTQSVFIPLEKMDYDFSQLPVIRSEILYADKRLYDSGQKLERNYILFDNLGCERMTRRGIAYLFAGESQSISFSNDEDGIYCCPHPGQLYRINLDEVSSVAVDGQEVFVNEAASEQFRCYTSIRRESAAQITEQGVTADIFSAPFEICLNFPQGEKRIRYQIAVDGKRQNADAFIWNDNGVTIPSVNDKKRHCVHVIDIADDFVKFQYNYIVLPDFRVEFDAPIYYENDGSASATIFVGNSHYTGVLPPASYTNRSAIVIPGVPWQLEVAVPIVRCSLMGENAFTAPAAIWYKDIPSSEYVQVDLPDGWEGCLMLDTEPVPAVRNGSFELGNVVRALAASSAGKNAVLWLRMKNQTGACLKRKITLIEFEPTFISDPLEVIENRLCWQPENNFIGDSESSFRIEVKKPWGTAMTFFPPHNDCELADVSVFPPGSYPYSIYLKKRSLFSAETEELIYSGEYCIGNPMEWMYKGKEIALGDALCWDFGADALKKLPMQTGYGILRELCYQGQSAASGERTAVPCYFGTMYFVDRNGQRIPFNSRESDRFELVNPVRVWIINEHLLILRCATEDPVYIDKKYYTIANRSPDTYMSRSEQEQRLETPDYFEYRIREDGSYV